MTRPSRRKPHSCNGTAKLNSYPLERNMDKPQSTELLFEMSHFGRRTPRLPECDVPAPSADHLLPAGALAEEPPPLPEVGEIDLVRHFINLSNRNMSIDTNFYP